MSDVLLALLHRVADAIADTLGGLTDWGLAGTRPGQYRSDLAADAVAVEMLVGAGLGVLSEESGRHHADRAVTVVVDPLDGSTNAHRGVPWFATSLCAVDEEGPLVAVVVDLAHGRRYEAVRGRGARCDGEELRIGSQVGLADAVVGISGLPARHLGWRQFRALGAAALDLCAVADGTLDAFVDCSIDAHGSWDYLGGLLVCREAGAVVADANGRHLVVLDHTARRTPIAATSAALLDEILEARRPL
ncbi:MAG: inositol monophosphatase [Acidimicrobiia bacterium]|nr:inositol monophosphatase [Acidimicrobiia bacterium]